MSPPDFSDLALRLVGAFYAFAGVVATRAGLTSRLLDVAIAAIDARKPNSSETGRAAWMLMAGIFILAGGIALVLRVDIAAWLFTLSALAQAVYLGVVAPRFLDHGDPPDPAGRQSTINAFFLYLAATAFVLWAFVSGKLDPWQTLPWPILPAAAAAVATYAGYAIYRFMKPLSV